MFIETHSCGIQSVKVCVRACVCVFSGFLNTLKWLQMSQGNKLVGLIQQQFFDSVNALYNPPPLTLPIRGKLRSGIVQPCPPVGGGHWRPD